MPVFAYKGRNGRGDLVEGTLDGDHSGIIADQLMNTGITPTEIKPSGTLNTEIKPDFFKRLTQEKTVSLMEVLLFSRQMYTLLKAGVPIMRALAGLQESTRSPAFSAVIQDLRESLDSGRELSAALRRHPKIFSAFYTSMVQVGEMTGMLDETFIRLYDHLEFERDMRERIKTAMRYPSFVLLAMAIAIVVINLFVIPAFAKVYAGFHAELPTVTKLLIGFSNFMVDYWALMLAILIAAVMGLRFYINTTEGRYKWTGINSSCRSSAPSSLKPPCRALRAAWRCHSRVACQSCKG
jgi:Type II secretory pathway, component PulF